MVHHQGQRSSLDSRRVEVGPNPAKLPDPLFRKLRPCIDARLDRLVAMADCPDRAGRKIDCLLKA